MDTGFSDVRVVGIGASAGGIESLKEFFNEMPAESGLAFVVVQHLAPTHVSQMAPLLARYTRMQASEAEEGTQVVANRVYTIPANKFLFIQGGRLHLAEPLMRDGLRMPIDFFFRSLALEQHERAIAVLFSGSGSDGTLGIREIRGAGGIVFVQDPRTAEFDSMIESAIATGLVDYVLPVRQIPATLIEYAKRTENRPIETAESETREDEINAILDLIVERTKTDFRCYKKATIHRRIDRRMRLSGIENVSAYYRILEQNPDELAKLAKDLLIGVTSFFRDAPAFEELKNQVIASLIEEKNTTDPLRIWIAGCATGEEAYSIVMLLLEEMDRVKKRFALQIFASDIDREALKSGREGIYSESIAADVSEERLKRFFVKKNSNYVIDKAVREAVTFAEHNVIADPPFLKMDLISCRNLLIYIDSEMQKRVLNLFAFALEPGGYLFLGKSEGILDQGDFFEPISRNFRIFRRTSSPSRPVSEYPLRVGPPVSRLADYRRRPTYRLSDLCQHVLMKHFNIATVLINHAGEILYFYGPTRKYLSHPHGDATLSVFDLIEKKHSVSLRLGVQRAIRDNQSVVLKGLEINLADQATQLVNVTIDPAVDPGSEKKLLAVLIEDVPPPLIEEPATPGKADAEQPDIIARLEEENNALRKEIQSATDGFQVTHEELMAANEEVVSINEELQSTNEELESSKEELQSVNEELVTVNSQVNEKVEELNQTNADLANLLNASNIATLFLDRAFHIRRFTTEATKLLNLIPFDIGRPISHISGNFVDVDLSTIAERILKDLEKFEQEVRTVDNRWFNLSCTPYRTLSNVIDGVVFTFSDITRLKQSEQTTIEDERRFAQQQKMESIGKVAAGIALEFSHLLRSIRNQTAALSEGGIRNRAIIEIASQIGSAAQRGTELVERLLIVGQKTQLQLKPTNVDELLRELMNSLQQDCPKNIELKLISSDSLPLVKADADQMMRALLSICANARNTMSTGGALTLQTDLVDGKTLQKAGEAKAAQYVSIAVSDSGPTMNPETQSRMFEPFFTGKESGEGNGLGLAAAYGIVRAHEGFIQVESRPVLGTTLRIYLPAQS